MKIGKKKEKETSKFDQGMKKLSLLLGNSTTPDQVGGVGGEVDASGNVDKHNEKMTEKVAVVLKSFMRKRGNRSKKNNRDNEEE